MAEPGGGASLFDQLPRTVMPGDDVTEVARAVKGPLRAGLGLEQRGDAVMVDRAGLLRFRAPNKLWVETDGSVYAPVPGDMVVGTVLEVHGEEYRVEIGAGRPARLDALAFDGASKRNKPRLERGDLVYAHVTSAQRHVDAEIACTSLGGRKKDWVTGESVFGPLKGGTAFTVPPAFAKTLRRSDCHVLRCLGRSLAFEIATGINGHVWVDAGSPAAVVAVQNAVLNSRYLSAHAVEVMVERLVSAAAQA